MRRFPGILVGLLATSLPWGRVGAEAPALTPPMAEKRPFTREAHGIAWQDEYFWLRDREDPKVKQYLEAENAYVDAMLAPLQPLRKKLVAEMRARIVDEEVSVPYRKGDWLYFSKFPAGKDYAVYLRRSLKDGLEQTLLDMNERAANQPTYLCSGVEVSPDDRLAAWKENTDGSDAYTIHIRDIASGILLSDAVPNAAFDDEPVWALDNRTLFYTEADDTQRSWRVKRHTLGEPVSADVVVYEEADSRFQVGIESTKSDRFLLIGCYSKDTSETLWLPLATPTERPKVMVPRREGLRYGVTDHEGSWYIVSNDGARDGKLYRAPEATPGRDQWQEVWPEEKGVSLTGGIDSFAAQVVLNGRKDGVPGMFIMEPRTKARRWTAAPVEGAWFHVGSSPEYASTTQRISYGSFLVPNTVADVELATGKITVLKQKTVPSGFDPAKYRVSRTLARAGDGVEIPIWLLLPANHPRDGSGGIVLEGYGAYGDANDPWFNTNIFSLLDRGVGFAVAQVRGGGEYGRSWYEAGKLKFKETTFSDYAACAEHLIREGLTSPAQLCGTGASAGGLLAGCVVNRWPGLFRAFVADVPFVDALNTMLDPTIPLTTSEYDEWGNPTASKEAFDLIRRYAPYENVKRQDYPAMLVTAGWNDPRVPYWESAKWVARLRAMKTDSHWLLFKTNLDTGHAGTSGRYSYLEDAALEQAFVLKMLGREGVAVPAGKGK